MLPGGLSASRIKVKVRLCICFEGYSRRKSNGGRPFLVARCSLALQRGRGGKGGVGALDQFLANIAAFKVIPPDGKRMGWAGNAVERMSGPRPAWTPHLVAFLYVKIKFAI